MDNGFQWEKPWQEQTKCVTGELSKIRREEPVKSACARSGVGKLIWLPCVLVNKVLLVHSHLHFFI